MVHVQQEEREGLPVVEQILLHVTDIYRASPRVETKMPFYNFEKFTFSRKLSKHFHIREHHSNYWKQSNFLLADLRICSFHTHILAKNFPRNQIYFAKKKYCQICQNLMSSEYGIFSQKLSFMSSCRRNTEYFHKNCPWFHMMMASFDFF